MAIEKLPEFSKNGQKNTDKLVLEDGFPVNLKPARQWFNFLFNQLTLSINQIIDENYIQHSEIIDNLTSPSADKPLSAKQGKALQDNKLAKTANAVSASKLEFLGNETLGPEVGGEASRYSARGAYFSGIFGGLPLGYPIGYGNRFVLKGHNLSATEVIHEWQSGSKDRLFVRSKGDRDPQQWSSYSEIAFTNSNITGNAATATKLQTARKITLSGAVSGNATFDGASDVTINVVSSDIDVLAYTPIPWMKVVPPSGFLVFMGQSISQAVYPILFSLYGPRLPDMRGEFIRGFDNGRGVDTGRALLSLQLDEFKSHNHNRNPLGDAEIVVSNNPTSPGDLQGSTWRNKSFTVTGDKGGIETRPRNIAFNYIVKAG